MSRSALFVYEEVVVTEVDLSADALAGQSPKQLVALVRGLDPADPAVKKLDIDVLVRLIDPKKLGNHDFVGLLEAIGSLADAGADVDLSAMSAQNFARIISRASSGQIEAVADHPTVRGRILDELFRRMDVHFQPERARDGKVTMHFRIAGGGGADGYDHYQVVIEDRACSVHQDVQEDAKTVITVSLADFLRLATGNASAPFLYLRGKVKVKGSLGFAAGFMSMFDIPKA